MILNMMRQANIWYFIERYQNLIKTFLELEKKIFSYLWVNLSRTLYNPYVSHKGSVSILKKHILESRIKKNNHTLIGYLM